MFKGRKRGFTLLELLISTGVISLAAFSLYGAYSVASDWRKTSSEVKALGVLFSEIDNSTNTTGKYSGIVKETLLEYGFTSALELVSLNAPSDEELSFNYKDLNPRICTEFVSKMLSSSKNISSVINGKKITTNNLSDIALACNGNYGKNDVAIILKKDLPAYTIDTVTASVNIPEPPPPDVVVPFAPIPAVVPTVPDFIPSTANPVVYGITGVAPTYPVIPPIGGGGPPILGNNNGTIPTMPEFIPPQIADAGNPEAAPPDDIDGEVLPPIITTETRTLSCPEGYDGAIKEKRTKTVLQGSGQVSYTAWQVYENSCVEASGLRTRYYRCQIPGYDTYYARGYSSLLRGHPRQINAEGSIHMIIPPRYSVPNMPTACGPGTFINTSCIHYDNQQLAKLNLNINNLCVIRGGGGAGDTCAGALSNFALELQLDMARKSSCEQIRVE